MSSHNDNNHKYNLLHHADADTGTTSHTKLDDDDGGNDNDDEERGAREQPNEKCKYFIVLRKPFPPK